MFMRESWSRGLLVLDVALVQKKSLAKFNWTQYESRGILDSWFLEWFLVYIIPLYEII